MASASSDEYEPSSDEDGHNRPNRWHGPSSTWLDMTSQEIATSVALEDIRNRDLAVHLYNAFALKREDGASLETPRQLVRVAYARGHCAPDDFMKRPEDRDDGFTIRRPVTGAEGAASFALEEAVSATVLRFAKEKFQARPWDEDDMILTAPDDTDGKEEGHEVLDESDSDGASRSRPGSRASSLKKEEQLDSDLDSASDGGASPVPRGPHYFKPVVSADDALSYDLLRPSTRHILSKLDATLMLATGQKSTWPTCKISPRHETEKGPVKEADPASSQTEDPGTMSRGEDREDETKSKKTRGRPKKQYPRIPGETDKQYAIRVARLRKEPRPVFSDDSETGIEPQSDASELKRKPTARPKASASRDPSSDRSSTGRKKRRRHNLRDWRDVLGAAAVAGFSQPALDRAARRCADLFGQGFELRTMEEDPVFPDKLLQYAPGMPLPNMTQFLHQESEDEEIVEDGRRRGRSSSVVSDGSRAPSRNASQNRERSGSVSSTGAGHQFFCTVEGCPRSTQGFSRNANLLRHLRQVHSLRNDGIKPMDVDSEDEMMGGVHVDGFLKPIKARRGWRGEANRTATTAPPEKKRRGGRGNTAAGPRVVNWYSLIVVWTDSSHVMVRLMTTTVQGRLII
ncbi:RNA polymerase I specific transcription initiation factor [Apiospora hydei]|uniref:RNA polymerase I specific transcription initiation factor n=1 Tax=Apiospora hydei TaxID=1337664 RepID=A0ABR1VU91_9PEZI